MKWESLKARRELLYPLLFLFLGGMLLLAASRPPLFLAITAEDCLLENLGEIFLFLAINLFLMSAWKKTRGKPSWGYWLMAAFCLLLALEEIDWGQRIFMRLGPVHLPAFITAHGSDRITLRAFLPAQVLGGRPLKFLLHLAFLLWGFVLPLLGAIFPRLGKKLKEGALPFPSLGIGFGILTGQAVSLMVEKIYTQNLACNAFLVWEAADFFNYLVLLLTAGEKFAALRGRGVSPGWQRPLLTVLILLEILIMSLIVAFGGEFPPLATGKPPQRTDLEIYTVLGNYYRQKGEAQEAKKYLEIAVFNNWCDPLAWYGLGEIYLKENWPQRAGDAFRMALEKAGGREDLSLLIGEKLKPIYRGAGEKEKLRELEQILQERTRTDD